MSRPEGRTTLRRPGSTVSPPPLGRVMVALVVAFAASTCEKSRTSEITL